MRTFTQKQIIQAKSISIIEILQKNGFEPQKVASNGTWFYSPFRNEKTASFFVDNKNGFYDFGSGVGGDVIKLICELQKITFVESVKLLLQENNFSFVSPDTLIKHQEKSEFTIEAIKPLNNKFFKDYLSKRKIDISIAQKYLNEVYYKTSPNQIKNFFGIGMENQSKGFEVKNCQTEKYYCLGSKDVTIIKNPSFQSWSIFESMFDFLASLTHFQKPIQSNVIILHSVSIASKILSVPGPTTDNIFLFLDNDKAGNEATKQLIEHFSKSFKTFDCRYIYQNHKDFNEFLIMRGK